jgi:hypothetical protein
MPRTYPDASTPASGPVALRPKEPPLVRALGLSLLALFWNGCLWPFAGQVPAAFRSGDSGRGLLLAMFLVAGLGIFLGAIHALLGLRNPRLHLTLDRGTLHLGETLEVEWKLTGLPERIRRLRIAFEGREEATYPSGRRHRTAREVFRTLPVVDTTEPASIAAGTGLVAIPSDTLHSFAAPHNRVIWSFKVTGEIRHWPDVGEEFEVSVLPQIPGGPR